VFKYIYSRKCISGEYLSEGGECRACGYGFYLIVPPEVVRSCKTCNANGICFGGNMLAPNNGYQRINKNSDQILKCFNPEACLAGDINNMYGICETGYTGLLCNICDDKYQKTNWKHCESCPEWQLVLT
jgi:hypothetical protein